jgi:hypothetical protein
MNVRQEGSHSHPERISSFSQLYYRPQDETPPITIRMPDGTFIHSNEMDRDRLSTYVESGVAYDYGAQQIIVVSYNRGRTTVYLDKQEQLSLLIVDTSPVYADETISGEQPAIGAPDNEKILEFPLREKEMIELFGEPTDDETYQFKT